MISGERVLSVLINNTFVQHDESCFVTAVLSHHTYRRSDVSHDVRGIHCVTSRRTLKIARNSRQVFLGGKSENIGWHFRLEFAYLGTLWLK